MPALGLPQRGIVALSKLDARDPSERTVLAHPARGPDPRTRTRTRSSHTWYLLMAIARRLYRRLCRLNAPSPSPLPWPVFQAFMRVLRGSRVPLIFLVLGAQRLNVEETMDAEAVLRLTLQPPQGATQSSVPASVREITPRSVRRLSHRPARPHHHPRR